MERTLEDKIDNIERYLMISAKNILTADEAATMLDMKVSMIYSLTSKHKIPFYKPNGKKIFFKKDELEQWVLSSRVSTDEELQQEAANITKIGRNAHKKSY